MSFGCSDIDNMCCTLDRGTLFTLSGKPCFSESFLSIAVLTPLLPKYFSIISALVGFNSRGSSLKTSLL